MNLVRKGERRGPKHGQKGKVVTQGGRNTKNRDCGQLQCAVVSRFQVFLLVHIGEWIVPFLCCHVYVCCFSSCGRVSAHILLPHLVSLGARVPGFWWEHAEYIAGIETLCLAFAQQEHAVHIWNVIWLCVPNVPIGNILFTAGMRPCHVSKMYPPRIFQVLSVHVHKMFSAHAQVGTLQIHQFV